jgi:HD-like signal output (HDOD) protein
VRLRTLADLSAEERVQLLDRLSSLQRPSGTLQQLLSPSLIETASSAELAELIQSEPLLAARVLATVNSAAYGLQRTVSSIGQAIVLIGVASVRRMALEQLLREALRPSDPLRQALCDVRWRASLLGSEICFHLAQRLALPDYGALSTQAVLASVGHYAVLSLREPAALQASAAMDPISRCANEEQELGLAAPALGALLLKSWALPQDLVNEVEAIEAVMVTPAPPGTALKPSTTSRAALACLCLRLGEQLATAGPQMLQTWSLQAQTGPEWFYLRQHLGAPAFARLDDILQAPEMQAAVLQQMAVA